MVARTLVIIYIFDLLYQLESTNVILGIHSLCLGEQEKSLHNNMAAVENEILTVELRTLPAYRYHYHDVCNDMNKMMNIAIDLMLSNRSLGNSNFIEPVSKEQLNVILIFAYLDKEMGKMFGDVAFILESAAMPIIFLNHEYNIPGAHLINPGLSVIRDISKAGSDILLEAIQFFHWTYVGVVFLNSTYQQTEVYRDLYKTFVRRLESQKETCFAVLEVDAEQVENYKHWFGKLRKDANLNVIYLIGWTKHTVTIVFIPLFKKVSSFILHARFVISNSVISN